MAVLGIEGGILVKKKVNNNIRMHVFYVFMLIFMIGLAVTTTFIGNLTPNIIEHYKLNYSQAGSINLLFQVGGFVSLLLGGMFSDRLKKSNIIISAAIIMSGGLCLIGITPRRLQQTSCYQANVCYNFLLFLPFQLSFLFQKV